MTNVEALLLLADAALYRAKASGRNRLEIEGEAPMSDAVRLLTSVCRVGKGTVVPLPKRKSAA